MTDLVQDDRDALARFLAAADIEQLADDPAKASQDIIARILRASTVEEVLGKEQVTHARDFLDTPFALLSVKFNRTEFDGDGPPFYAVLSGATDDGEPVTITCGAGNVMAQAFKLDDMKALPYRVVIRQNPKPTAAGFHVMWLEAAPVAL